MVGGFVRSWAPFGTETGVVFIGPRSSFASFHFHAAGMAAAYYVLHFIMCIIARHALRLRF